MRKDNPDLRFVKLKSALNRILSYRAHVKERRYYTNRDTEQNRRYRHGAATKLRELRDELWFAWRQWPENRPGEPWAAHVMNDNAYRYARKLAADEGK